MTAPIYGPWQAHNAMPDSTCPPDAVGRRVQVQTFEARRVDAVSHDPRYANSWDWADTGVQDPIIAYRILIEPVLGEIVLTGYMARAGRLIIEEANAGWHTLTITMPTINNALIPGEYIGPDGATIVVGVV